MTLAGERFDCAHSAFFIAPIVRYRIQDSYGRCQRTICHQKSQSSAPRLIIHNRTYSLQIVIDAPADVVVVDDVAVVDVDVAVDYVAIAVVDTHCELLMLSLDVNGTLP